MSGLPPPSNVSKEVLDALVNFFEENPPSSDLSDSDLDELREHYHDNHDIRENCRDQHKTDKDYIICLEEKLSTFKTQNDVLEKLLDQNHNYIKIRKLKEQIRELEIKITLLEEDLEDYRSENSFLLDHNNQLKDELKDLEEEYENLRVQLGIIDVV